MYQKCIKGNCICKEAEKNVDHLDWLLRKTCWSNKLLRKTSKNFFKKEKNLKPLTLWNSGIHAHPPLRPPPSGLPTAHPDTRRSSARLRPPPGLIFLGFQKSGPGVWKVNIVRTTGKHCVPEDVELQKLVSLWFNSLGSLGSKAQQKCHLWLEFPLNPTSRSFDFGFKASDLSPSKRTRFRPLSSQAATWSNGHPASAL